MGAALTMSRPFRTQNPLFGSSVGGGGNEGSSLATDAFPELSRIMSTGRLGWEDYFSRVEYHALSGHVGSKTVRRTWKGASSLRRARENPRAVPPSIPSPAPSPIPRPPSAQILVIILWRCISSPTWNRKARISPNCGSETIGKVR